jgi:hypothetical protein
MQRNRTEQLASTRSRARERTPSIARRREGGIAMITVVLIIFLLMASALSSVDFTEQESRASGQSRATMRSLYAADAGIQLAMSRVETGDFSAFSVALTDGTVVESRRRTDGAPQPIAGGGSDVQAGPPPDGFQFGEGGGFAMQVYPLNATAVGNNDLTSELEAKVGVLSAGPGYD